MASERIPHDHDQAFQHIDNNLFLIAMKGSISEFWLKSFNILRNNFFLIAMKGSISEFWLKSFNMLIIISLAAMNGSFSEFWSTEPVKSRKAFLTNISFNYNNKFFMNPSSWRNLSQEGIRELNASQQNTLGSRF